MDLPDDLKSTLVALAIDLVALEHQVANLRGVLAIPEALMAK